MARRSKLTLEQIQSQIASLQTQAEALRKREAQEVLERIKEAIAHYGFNAADLGLRAGSAKAALGKRRSARSRSKGTIRFKDAHGHTWTGVGKRPNWYKEAIASGLTPEDLSVK